MSKDESLIRYDLSGKPTHTDYYENGQKVGSSVDRYNLTSSDYNHTDNYDKHGKKTGTSQVPRNDD
ncbi:MAG: hypothetical protein PHD15_06170 [Clostridia bacterium]|nr:hypothetical protein [Clostridia bacterium]MDD4387316.1 hypothetical protein [Clostridia bacterium]